MMNELEHDVGPDIGPPADPSIFLDSTEVDSLIRSLMAQYHIPGAATLILKNGHIIWGLPFGYANIRNGIMVADSTIFTVMSISKTMVAWAVMQLWERGVFGLDDNINNYLPFRVIHPRYPDSVMTFRMLMAHTSGLRDASTVLAPLISWGSDSPIPLAQFMRDYLVPGGMYYDPDSNFTTDPPGTAWKYCNVGPALLAYIVERISSSFPAYCRDSIFSPLSMNRTGWFLSELDTMDMAMPYRWNGSSYIPYGQYGHPMYPAGWLRTSVRDLGRSLQTFMQHGQIDSVRILDSITVEMMTTVQYPAIEPAQGLIWYILRLFGREVWGHAGGGRGISTFQFYCPAENTGVIVLTNGESLYGTYVIGDVLFDYASEVEVTESRDRTAAPRVYRLYQNHPNPFKSATTIDFELKTAAPVRLDVYDVTGQRVARLLDRELGPGRYSVRFDGRRLPRGVYYYSMSCPGLTRTRRCVLVR